MVARKCSEVALGTTNFSAMSATLAMVKSTSSQALRQCAGRLLCDGLGMTWAECLYLDGSGRWLGRDGTDARFDCDDYHHPYAHVIRHGKPLTLGLTEARSRLEHGDFQTQVAALPSALRLQVRPLRALDDQQEWLGVLVLASRADILDVLADNDEFVAFEALLCRLWARLSRDHSERQRSAALRESLVTLNAEARRQALAEQLRDDLLGDSAEMCKLRSQIVRAAETSLAVLLQGQTGTGKECVARALHRVSLRSKAPFVAINCAAIPEALLESELFGHAKGAFSGAERNREGLINQADGGTLFLDEIGDMPLALQAKLLRVLENGRYRPLGADEERSADLRLIAATHQPLRERIRDQRFRADLYYRLGQLPLSLPPLAERREDIAPLAQAFVNDFCSREGRDEVGITPAALRELTRRDYPGNVRELRNLIDYACAMSAIGSDIDVAMLPCRSEALDLTCQADAMLKRVEHTDDLRQALRDVEAELIRRRLRDFDGNRALAAESLGVPKRTLAHKCRLLELDA